MAGHPVRFVLLLALLLAVLAAVVPGPFVHAAPATYYVSSSGGDDGNPGTEPAPFKTVAKVNSLNLQPGDRVLFKCGDTWQVEQLTFQMVSAVVPQGGRLCDTVLSFISSFCLPS